MPIHGTKPIWPARSAMSGPVGTTEVAFQGCSIFDPERTLVTCARKTWQERTGQRRQLYFLTAASMLLPALARSSGTITG